MLLLKPPQRLSVLSPHVKILTTMLCQTRSAGFASQPTSYTLCSAALSTVHDGCDSEHDACSFREAQLQRVENLCNRGGVRA